MARRKTATKQEVLQFYTNLLRMEFDDMKSSDAAKAAEFFTKYYGMLEKDDQESKKRVVIVDDIAKAQEE